MLKLLGEPHVEAAGARLGGLPEKAFVLLALLLLEYRGAASRDRLQTDLWEHSSRDKAAASLRWLLSSIRGWEHTHGQTLVHTTRTAVSLQPNLNIDVAVLLDSPALETQPQLEAMLRLYGGPLLQDLASDMGPQLSATLAQHRALLQGRFIALILAAAERSPGEQAERLLRQLQRMVPDDERVTRALLLHLHREQGDRAVAQEFESFKHRLKAEYEVDPSVETLALAAQLMPHRVPATAVDTVAAALTANEPAIPKVAILPPTVPLGAPARLVTLGQALVEDVVLYLCRARTFALFAPYTARQLDGAEPVTAVAPLGATFVGSTRLLPAAGGGYRLTFSLIHAPSRQILFADQFAFDEDDLERRAYELAQVVGQQVSFAIQETALATHRATGSNSAYVQTLLGLRQLQPFDLKALRRARGHFAQALELSPNYVPALTGMARTLTKERLALRRSEPELVAKASAIAERASDIDPTDPETWREQAQARLYLHDIDSSLEFSERATTGARHYADILAEKADILTHASRSAEAKATIEQALRLNPMPPDWYFWVKGTAEFFLGQHAEALNSLLQIKTIPGASRLTAAAAAMAGEMAIAARYRRRWLELYPDSRLADVPKFMPHADRQDVQHFIDAARRAGFP